MKFTLAIDKHNRTSVSQCEGHNARHHPTKSQLPKSAWLTPQGHHTIKAWDEKVMQQARDLAKRKDAVLAVELVIQVGNQTEWREVPTEEHPCGKPMRGNSARMNALVAGAKAAISSEIGWDRVISVELHTDESSPHVHIVFAPINEGKLQSKHWLGGASKCAQFRERIHRQVTKHLACEYTKGEPGGDPHDPEKAAGKSRSPAAGVVAALKGKIQELEHQVQQLFSQVKGEQRKRAKLKAEYDEFTEQMAKRDQVQRAKIGALQVEIEALKPRPESPAKKATAVDRDQEVEKPHKGPSGPLRGPR